MSAELSNRLAKKLKEARKEKALSLDALAKLSGVSRSMLSAIERSESSPTIAILWNLTRSLNLDFAGLLDSAGDETSPIIDIVRAQDAPVILTHGEKCKIKILSAPETVGNTEIYELEFQKEGVLKSEPHRHGCTENLTVISGTIRVESDGESEVAYAGDTVRYRADRPHMLSVVDDKARAILIVNGS